MIDIENERLISIADAVKKLPRRHTGKPIHLATAYRWAQRGVRGVKLETIRAGNALLTSVEALQRFCERCTDPSVAGSTTTTKARQREMARAESELDAAGIGCDSDAHRSGRRGRSARAPVPEPNPNQ